ncbi:hypothetical protein B0H13DRAFT_1892936 [Mycena leptocephala]|nr:hypothetical protein B0H13DRAFT_1892936 [Mycena leptocephala]
MSIMEGRPYDEHWERMFAQLDVQSLFRLSLRSKVMFGLVMDFVRMHMPEPCHSNELLCGGPWDSFSRLPFDPLHIIFAYTRMVDKLSLARISKKFRTMCARELAAAIAKLIAVYDLTHAEIRFMQTATLTVFTGCLVANMLNNDFTPASLLFFSPHDAYPSVIRFFDLATPYNVFPADTLYGATHFASLYSQRFSRMVSLPFGNRQRIGLHSIRKIFPSHACCYTLRFVDESAAAGVTYPNRDAMDFGDSGTVYPVGALLGGAVHNLRVKFSLDRHHQCGVSFDCPSNIEPAPGEPIAIFGVKPDVIQSTPNFGGGFYSL